MVTHKTMIKANKNSNSKESRFRLSVLDTLLNRNGSEMDENETLSENRQRYSDSDKNSHHISPPSSQNLSENGVTNSTINSPMFHETKTPTTRAEQLPLLLARNYYTAPACLLRFINTSSTIKSYTSRKRDSDGTVMDSEFEPIADCNVDTNDEMDEFKIDEDGPEVFSVGAMTNRTSLISDHFPESEDFAYMGVDPVDLNLVIQSVKSRYSPHFDKGCSPFIGNKKNKKALNKKVTMDKATSPLYPDDGEWSTKRNSTIQPSPEPDLKPEVTHLESYKKEDSKDLNTTDVDVDVDFPTSEPFPEKETTNESPKYSTLESGDFSIKPQLSPKKKLPVYSRSQYYRIKVPLSKRLKNVDEGVLAKSLGSPLLSTTRVNLSCDRRYTSFSKISNLTESPYSFLRLSDLDSNSKDSSRAPSILCKGPSRVMSRSKHDSKHKSETVNLPSQEIKAVRKRSKRSKGRLK